MAESLHYQQRVPHPAPCFSWFLVQLEAAPSLFTTIHTVDIVDGLRTVYYNRKLKFLKDKIIFSGLVICASGDKSFIEEQLKKIIVATPDARSYSYEEYCKRYRDESHEYSWFLVQYTKGSTNVIHAVVHRNDVSWHSEEKANHREVLVCDGDVQHLATVLYISHSQTEILEQLYQLKEKCLTYLPYPESEKDDASSMTLQPLYQQNSPATLQPWMLVQYSCGPNNFVYAVVNANETVWQQENQYPDVVAYLTDGTNIYQSFIMKRSFEKDEVCIELQNIRERCLLIILPINKENENLCIDYSQKSERAKLEENHSQTNDKCIQTDSINENSGKKDCGKNVTTEDKFKKELEKEDAMTFHTRLEMVAFKSRYEEKEMEAIVDKMNTLKKNMSHRLQLLNDALRHARNFTSKLKS